MLRRAQHDNSVLSCFSCHPEQGPEPCPESSNVILNLFQDQGLTNSGSIEFGVSLIRKLTLGLKARSELFNFSDSWYILRSQ
jgi:hypothetical protein